MQLSYESRAISTGTYGKEPELIPIPAIQEHLVGLSRGDSAEAESRLSSSGSRARPKGAGCRPDNAKKGRGPGSRPGRASRGMIEADPHSIPGLVITTRRRTNTWPCRLPRIQRLGIVLAQDKVHSTGSPRSANLLIDARLHSCTNSCSRREAAGQVAAGKEEPGQARGGLGPSGRFRTGVQTSEAVHLAGEKRARRTGNRPGSCCQSPSSNCRLAGPGPPPAAWQSWT